MRAIAQRRHVWLLPLGSGIVATTLGVAVGVSKLTGRGIEVAAWSAVGAGVLLVVLGTLARLRRIPTVKPAERHASQIGGRARRLGDEIVAFAHQRDAQKPRPPRGRLWVRMRVEHATARAQHDDDTMSIYERSFAARVRLTVQELRGLRRIGANEADRLLTPADPGAIEGIGVRLIELGDLVAGVPVA